MTLTLLALDIGTTGLKAALVSAEDGAIVGSESATYPTFYGADGCAEQTPADWWTAAVSACAALSARFPKVMQSVAGVGVGGMMNGVVLIDGMGQVVRPALLHADTRSAAQCALLEREVGIDAVFAATANRPDPHLTLPKVMWLRDNEPHTLARAAFCVQAKDYLRGQITGVFGQTDPSDASLTGAWDVARGGWRTDLWEGVAGLPVRLLPDVLPSAAIAGYVTPEAARLLGVPSGVPVVTGGGDGACATAGAGVAVGEGYLYLGGTAWVGVRTLLPPTDSRLSAYACLDGRSVTAFGTCQSAGTSVDWLRIGVFGDEETPLSVRDRDAAGVAPGADGLFFLSYLQGERSPLWDAAARGVFFGLSTHHGQAHLLRAVREGVGYALASICDVFEAQGTALSQLRLLGGGAQSGLWETLLPAILHRALLPLQDESVATVRGAALCAGVGVGAYAGWEAALALVQTSAPLSADPALAAAYVPLRHFYGTLYPLLRERFAALQEAAEATLPL